MTILADETAARDYVAALPAVDALAMDRLDQFCAMLVDETEKQNLVSRDSLAAVWQRHIADSAQLLEHVSRETFSRGPWIDVGTGAGFPGLVIAALCPQIDMWLVEPRDRRAQWLETAIAGLQLPNARVCPTRAERLVAPPAAVISARALAPLAKIFDLSAGFSTKQTCFLLPRGRKAAQDLSTLMGRQHCLRIVPSRTEAASGILVGSVLAAPAIQTKGKRA